MPAQLALFDTNAEYRAVTEYMTVYIRNLSRIIMTDVWVNLVVKDMNKDSLWEHWWTNEIFDDGVWANGDPDAGCKLVSPVTCCARLSWMNLTYSYLRDKWCNEPSFNFLCKSINECRDNTDNCSQLCVDKALGFECSCYRGYMLKEDKAKCMDVNECLSNPCSHTCINTEGYYNCSCYSGFLLSLDQHTCEDVDECLDRNKCQHLCTNTQGSYQCRCSPGYSLRSDNFSCTDVDECSMQNNPCQGICSNTAGTYICECLSGFILSSNGSWCNDVDECSEIQHLCSGPCTNTQGSFFCGCPEGFEVSVRECVDVDECETSSHNCSQICQNDHGTYNCKCVTGFRESSKCEGQCEDIDECCDNTDVCDHTCVNNEGSYACSCLEGFKLDTSDNSSCHDINECMDSPHICQHRCINTAGSFHCSCEPGFSLKEDRRSCVEISYPRECPCSCLSPSSLETYTPDRFSKETEELQRQIALDKKSLYSFSQRKFSVSDTRLTSKAVGASGAALMLAFFGILLMSDVLNLIRFLLSEPGKR